ncbi:DUF2911 domain-containing protein [Maribacter sp.]
MKIPKWLKIVGLLIIGLWLLMKFVAWPLMQRETKKISPEKTTTFVKNGYDLSLTYSSPSKKGRVIFGELVPYNTIWRTGANEPTSFTTKTDIKIMNTELPAGSYSLWTKPGRQSWTVIFNEEIPDWGVTLMSGGKETTRNPEKDVLQVEVLPKTLASPQENFTIVFQDTGLLHLALSWDETIILVPISK